MKCIRGNGAYVPEVDSSLIEAQVEARPQSGHWDERGCGMGRYQMCRLGPDIGDYAPDNVKIITHEQNVRARSPEVHLAGVRRRSRRKSWRTNVVAAIHRRFAEKRRRAQEASL